MTCYYPKQAWRSRSGKNPNGSWPITFNRKHGYEDLPITVPCSRCIGCRLERSRQWAIRIMHEASLHKNNNFLTLTYNNENLPIDNNLRSRDLTLFFKRLRKNIGKFRYFACGEYGDRNHRPHYHAIIFGLDFIAGGYLYDNSREFPIYRNESLEEKKLWGHGLVGIGNVSFESAAYTARYIVKKQLGLPEGLKDCVIDFKTGEILHERTPEFVTMSRRPGIARDYYDKYKNDIYPHDFVVLRNGMKSRPSRYYDNLYDLENPKKFKKLKIQRKLRAEKLVDTDERLQAKEHLKKIKNKKLVRPLE